MKKRPTKTDYERHLNDHPIKAHPLYRVWQKTPKVRHSRWGAWLRETNRPIFNDLYDEYLKHR